jgi:hypothetical protein
MKIAWVKNREINPDSLAPSLFIAQFVPIRNDYGSH